jgi:hypothetical protein
MCNHPTKYMRTTTGVLHTHACYLSISLSLSFSLPLFHTHSHTRTQGNAGQGGPDRRGVDDGNKRPPSVKASLSVAFGQRAPNRAGAREDRYASAISHTGVCVCTCACILCLKTIVVAAQDRRMLYIKN